MNNEDAILDDVDLVIESLAKQGLYDEAARIRKASQSPVRREAVPHYSAFEISNCILDVIDEGHLANGHRWGWKFDYPSEDRANQERLDFRDAVLARLRASQS